MEARGVVSIIFGAILLLWPRRISDSASKKHEERLASLRDGAEETYFEERRALETYRPPRHALAWRLLGTVLIIAGLIPLLDL